MSLNIETLNENAQRVHRKLTILLRVGILLMESAADTNRIVRNMKRIAAFLGLDERYLNIDVLYGTLKVNYSDETHSYSRFSCTQRYTINMRALAAISQLSWHALQKDYTMTRFENVLARIARGKRDYPLWVVMLCTAMGCGGFSVLFGGDWPSFLPATIAGLVGYALRYFLLQERFNVYMVTAFTAFVATLVAWGTVQLLPEGFTSRPYHPMVACALFLVPGVALINFLDDMLDNYLLVGLARLANGVVQMASMAFGIVLAVNVTGEAGSFTSVSLAPIISYWEAAVATAIAAIGFAMNFNVPRRTLFAIAMLAMMGMCLRNFLGFDLGQGLVIGSLAAASLISIVSVRLVQPTRSPNHVLTIPSVIPMVPGILMYRGIFGLVHFNNEVDIFMRSSGHLLTAALILLCLSVGVAIPNIFARRWIAASRRAQLDKLIEERRCRGRFLDLAAFD